MVATNVVEASQHPIIPADNDNGLSCHACRDELARFLDLLNSPDHLPGSAEDRAGFELSNARIHVPGRGDGRRFREARLRVITSNDILHSISSNHRLFTPKSLMFRQVRILGGRVKR
jgi:hypothetical protein